MCGKLPHTILLYQIKMNIITTVIWKTLELIAVAIALLLLLVLLLMTIPLLALRTLLSGLTSILMDLGSKLVEIVEERLLVNASMPGQDLGMKEGKESKTRTEPTQE